MKYLGTYDEGKPEFDYRNINESMEAENAWLDSLPGQTIRFQVADGCAIYLYKDGGLYHVPVGDEYAVHPALIRGLTKQEVEAMTERDKRLRGLFG